jgi:methyl-accepting chemotaxis protein
MKISDLKIGTRLGLGFGIVLLLLAAITGLGLKNMAANSDTMDKIDDNNVKLNTAWEMSYQQQRVSLAGTNVVLLTDATAMAEQERVVGLAREKYNEASALLHKMLKLEEGKAILARIDAAAAQTRPLTDKARKLGLENKNEEATAVLMQEVGPAAARWQGALHDMIDHQKENNKLSSDAATQSSASARVLMIGLGVLAMALGVGIAWLSTRSITVPLLQALKVAQTVASGDLSAEIRVDRKDETGDLLAALKAMNASLHNIVGRVRSGTDLISAASTEIASGNLDLSARTEQQASSLEETAASMEELTSTVKQNAENARQANMLATSASDVAVRGGQVVSKVVDTMSSINDSSRKIVDIIGVIDSIAFQTNILALNAAVEAARAGEQGRGFAVVASEVRNLAQRSASAAKEIKSLIDDSVSKVALGSSLVNNAGSTMDEVVASVKRVTDIMAEISAAGREQELGIAQINQAVMEMDTVTQQNAALVEEAAAAAASMQEQASQLTGVVSVFQLGAASASSWTAPVQALAPRRAPARPAGSTAVLTVVKKTTASPKAPRRAANTGDWEEF